MSIIYPIFIGVCMCIFIWATGLAWKYILNLKGEAYLIYGITPVMLPLLLVTIICNSFTTTTDIYLISMSIALTVIIAINIVSFYVYREKLGAFTRSFRITKYIKENWFVYFVVIMTLFIALISMNRTIYGISNTDDTTYLGIQSIMDYYKVVGGYAPTSGLYFDTSSISYMLMVSLQWSQLEYFFSWMFQIDMLVFNRISMTVFTIALSIFIIKPIGNYLLSRRKAQFILIPLLILFIWPIFSGSDPWGQIVRLLNTTWFGSAMYVIIVPTVMLYWFLQIIDEGMFVKRDIIYAVLFIPVAALIHSIGITFVLEFLAAIVVVGMLGSFKKLKPIIIPIILIFMLVLFSVIDIYVNGISGYVLIAHKELIVLWKNLLTPIIIVIGLIGCLVIVKIHLKEKKSKIVKVFTILITLIIFTILVAVMTHVLGVNYFPLFGYRRMIDSYCILLLITIAAGILHLVNNKKKRIISIAILIISILVVEVIYPNNLVESLRLVKANEEYLQVWNNPAKVHPVTQEIGDFFNENEPEATVFGVRYIYSPDKQEMLVLTDSVRLIAGGLISYANIRDYDKSIYGEINKSNLDEITSGLSCLAESCLQAEFDSDKVAGMLRTFVQENNIKYLIVPELTDQGIEHPMYQALLNQGFISTKEFNGYDLETPIHLLILEN